MGAINCVSAITVLLLLECGQKITLGDHEDGDIFGDVMKDLKMSNMVKKMAMSTMSMVKEQDMMFLKAGVDTQDTTSTTAMKAMFTNTKERARQMGEGARSRNLLLNELSAMLNIPKRRMANSVNGLLNDLGIEVQGLGTRDDSCDESDNIQCDRFAKYRTIDGTCNNLRKPIWGASFISYRRFLKPAYDDEVSSPRMASTRGGELPSARRISLTVHEADRRLPKAGQSSHMLMQWGQFLDHDITSTPISSGAGGANARCCREDVDGRVVIDINPEDRDICFPIRIPNNDPQFSPKRCLNFVRSIQIQNTECQQAPVEQMNQITAFIDGSAVYGSSDEEMRDLRTMTGGLLKTSQNDLLPESERPTCLIEKRTDFCFKAGDGRVNEQMGLATLHTIFMREHNRMARELAQLNRNWDDETLFQETRKILGAKLQHITYKEFLPIVLNRDFRRQFNLVPKRRRFDNSYDDNTDPSIRNGFAAAAYRFGHSMVRTMFSQLGHNYERMEDLRLTSSFGNTSHLIDENGDGVNRYIRGLVTDNANNIDRFMTPQMTQLLFEDGAGNSLDLAAINIQRGRDHGLPSYNQWRNWCNLPVARAFDGDRGGLVDHPPHAITRLRRVYSHPDDIDLFAGGISERRLRGSMVGPTFACILAHQFKALKEGDRFWYERDDRDTGFTANQLDVIRETTLSKVLCDNTDIETIQPNAFRIVGQRNGRLPCGELTQPALTPWSEDPEVRDSINGNNGNNGFDNGINGFDNGNDGNIGFDNGNNDNNGFDNGNNFNTEFDNGNNGNTGFDNDNTGSNNGNTGFDNDNTGSNNGNNGFDNDNTGSNNGNNGFDNDNTGSNNGNNGFDNDNTGSNNGNNGFDNDNTGSNNGNNGNNGFDNDNIGFDHGSNTGFGNGNNDNPRFGNGNNANFGDRIDRNENSSNDDIDGIGGNFGNGNNGNSDFGNNNDGNGDFRNNNNGNGDFGNSGNGDFRNNNNGNGDFGNSGNGDFRNNNNGNGDFGNSGNGDFRNNNNGNSDFGNSGNGDFHDGNGNNRNNDFANDGNNDFRNDGNGNFRNSNTDNGNLGNSNNENDGFGNSNTGNVFNNENNGNGDFENGNNRNGGDFQNGNDFTNQNSDFDNRDTDDEFRNGISNFGNENNNFGNENNNFESDGNGFSNGNNDFVNGNDNVGKENNGDFGNNGVPGENTRNNGFASWGQWSICLRGKNTRIRSCPVGRRCFGIRFQHKTCGFNTWSDWTEWSDCNNGRETRQRRCTGLNLSCVGSGTDNRPCASLNTVTWSPWGRWSLCINGRRWRRRVCTVSGTSNRSLGCFGPSSESQMCSSQDICSQDIFRFLCQ